MRKYIALILGKIIAKLLRLLNKTGGSLPGKIAVKICPNLLSYFKYPQMTILVTGTNGKTSTSNMITRVLQNAGIDTVSNSRGDNIVNGIASLLIKNSSLDFKIKSKAIVIEIDELTLAKQYKNLKPSDIVITNFFRDQLDRAGEMETIITKISTAIKDYRGNLYINEDDPNVKRFAYEIKNAKIISYGVEKSKNAKDYSNEAKEGKFCPLCKSPLVYEYYQYSHIGKYKCESCDFASKKPDYLVEDIQKDSFLVNKNRYNFSISALYHIYNLSAVIALSSNYNIDSFKINEVIKDFSLGIGRMEKIEIQGRKLLLNLVKNPTGCNEIIKYIENQDSEKSILFLLNDNYADGRDTSWIWDVNFEQITGLKNIIITGKRAYEMAIRFKLSEISANINVQKDIDKAIDLLLDCKEEIFVISTYTGLFEIRSKLLARK